MLDAVIPQRSYRFAADGFEIVRGVLSSAECDLLATDLGELHNQRRASVQNNRGGLRNLLSNPNVRVLADSIRLKALVEGFLAKPAFAVRALFFDKTAKANWFVPWHQDLMIAVAEREQVEGFEAWCLKEGVVHVQPPAKI